MLSIALLLCLCLCLCGCGGRGLEPASGGANAAPDVNQESSSATDLPNRDGVGEAPDEESPPSGELLAYRDLAYSPPAGVTSDLARVDLFRIDDGRKKPLVLLVHGGSWIAGDKAGFADKIVPWWLERGYAAAAVNFRLATRRGESPEVKPSDQVRDLAAALAWLMEEADTYALSTEGVILLGYSSGAHLVALLGTDERYVREAGLDETQINGVISLDVHAYDVPLALDLMVGSVVEGNIPSIRHLFGTTAAEQLAASPISYLDGWAAPTLIISVDEAPEVPGTHGYIVSQAAQNYVGALREAGHVAETIHDRSESHDSLVRGFGEPGDLATGAIADFLEEVR